MSQRIADALGQGSAIILPPAPNDGQRPFGLLGQLTGFLERSFSTQTL
jgi:hypothetical protein